MSATNLIHKGNWVLYTALFAFLLPVLLLGNHILQDTGGIFSLPRDEAFFQLSTAKTLAFKQIWGIDKHGFESASPSLAYPLLLAIAFFIFGTHLLIIPILNTVIAILLLMVIQGWLITRSVRPMMQLLILLAVIFLTPLPVIVLYGMERTLLLLFAFLFISRLSTEWPKAEFSRQTFIYGALLVATRYDGAILIAAVCFPLLVRRKWIEAFELTLWSLLPILVFGFIALKKGSYFIPNIFLVRPAVSQFSYDWLIGCGIALLPLLPSRLPAFQHSIGRWVMAGLAIVLLTMNVYAFREADESSLRIYRQEYPAGQFLHRHYRGYGILSDDMGVVSYWADGQLFDLSGIGNTKIAWGKKNNFPSKDLVHQLTENYAQIAVISDKYKQSLPENWMKIGSWDIPGYGHAPKKTLIFYASDTPVAKELKNNLVEYKSFLPKDFTVSYYYSP